MPKQGNKGLLAQALHQGFYSDSAGSFPPLLALKNWGQPENLSPISLQQLSLFILARFSKKVKGENGFLSPIPPRNSRIFCKHFKSRNGLPESRRYSSFSGGKSSLSSAVACSRYSFCTWIISFPAAAIWTEFSAEKPGPPRRWRRKPGSIWRGAETAGYPACARFLRVISG